MYADGFNLSLMKPMFGSKLNHSENLLEIGSSDASTDDDCIKDNGMFQFEPSDEC